jgi:hypothetical protein
MSLEMLVFLEKSRIPDRGSLQSAVESLGVPLQLNLCVLGASAALVKLCDAVAYYPPDSITYDLKSLLDELQGCLKQI